PRIVANTEVGKTVEVTVWRDGQKQSLQAEVALRDPAATAELAEPPAPMPKLDQHSTSLGMTLVPLDDDIRRELRIDKGVSGALVAAVEAGGPAATNGLQPGDV